MNNAGQQYLNDLDKRLWSATGHHPRPAVRQQRPDGSGNSQEPGGAGLWNL